MVIFLEYAIFKVDIHKSVQLIQNNIDVVGADSCRQSSESLPFVCACMGYEFAVLDLVFYVIKVCRNGLYSALIAYNYHCVSNLLWL